MYLKWIAIYFLPTLGFVLALLLLAHILRQRRSPTSTLAWLLAIVFIPYVGVPLYLMIGGRKMVRRTTAKNMLRIYPGDPDSVDDERGLPLNRGGWYPKVKGNRISLLADGRQAFERVIAMIEDARERILVTTYILANDNTGTTILKAMAKQASRGVAVYLLLDAMGSYRTGQEELRELREAGGRASFFMPMMRLPFRGRANLRNHRKMLLTDNREAVIGGMNLGEDYMGGRPNPNRWRDLSLHVMGPAVAHMADLFSLDWHFASGEVLPIGPVRQEPIVTADQDVALRLVASGPDVPGDPLRELLLGALFRAQHRVWLVTPYFVPDELLLESLCLAAGRGIDLRLIIPQKSNHAIADVVRSAYLDQLQDAGAQIWLYRNRMLHAKAVIIDNDRAVVGSANMDMRSLLLNYEAGLFIESRISVNDLETWAEGLLADCSLRSRNANHALGLVESVARLFAPLL